MREKKTEDLLNKLMNIKKRSDLNKYFEENAAHIDNHFLPDYILKICQDKGLGKSDIIRNADINRNYGYQILSGLKAPSRDKLLQICIGNGFTLEQANKAMTIGNLGILYAKDPRDSIMIYSLNNSLNLIETNIILDEHGYKLLGD